MDALAGFTPATRSWFEQAFAGPTPAQLAAWPVIATGAHVLVQAPTGSGKTLAAFLTGIDRLNARPGEGLRLLYISPLKALNYDVERNLRGPLAGLGSTLTVGVRTGDTDQRERRLMLRTPPDILITTPESLFLLLTSQGKEMLRGVETVIVDEVHAVAGTKRGAHLALSLERLERVADAAVPADRPLGDATAARGDRALRLGRQADRARRRGHPQGARPRGRRRARGHARAGLGPRPQPARAARRRRDGFRLRGRPRARSGPRSTRPCSSSSGSTARRSSSSTTGGSRSGSRFGSTSSPRRRSRGRTTARSRASSASRSRSC